MFKPNNIPQLIPCLVVRDALKSIDFYRDALGFELEECAKDENGNPQHVKMRKQEAYIMFSPEEMYGNTKKAPINLSITMPINLYMYCEDTDKLYNQAIDNGARCQVPPYNAFWGDRFCIIVDIDGYEWSFATLLSNS